MSAPEIVWEDPPPSLPQDRCKGKGRWQVFTAALKEHPGKWALAQSGFTAQYQLAALQSRLKKTYGLEAVSRLQSDGTYKLYARWPEDAS